MTPLLEKPSRQFAGPAVIILAALLANLLQMLWGNSCGHDFDFHLVSWLDCQNSWSHVKSQPAPAAAQASIAGDWQGTLNAGQAQLRLVLHITAGKDGALTSSLDSIDQGANGIPVSATSMKESKLSLTVDAVHGTYEGTVNKDVSEIDGTWTQTMPLPLKFTRAQPQVAAKPGPPSDVDGTCRDKASQKCTAAAGR